MANEKDAEIPGIQVVIITLKDGRTAKFSGPAQLKGGEIIDKVEVHEPRPLPPGVTWGPLEDPAAEEGA